MLRFYTQLWLFWVLRMLFVTIVLTSAISLLITFILYLKEGMPKLESEIYRALYTIFSFWFLLLLNLTIPLALFINAKYLFNRCINGVSLKLLSCAKDEKREVIETIGYGDLVKVWRKWLFLIVWNSAVLMLLSVAYSYLFTSNDSIFDWFNVYILYFFILISGYSSIVLLTSRCKSVRISKC